MLCVIFEKALPYDRVWIGPTVRMANELYKDHFLLWNPVRSKAPDTWFPQIIISWAVNGKYQFHRFKGPPEISHETALALGKKLAQAWVDKNV